MKDRISVVVGYYDEHVEIRRLLDSLCEYTDDRFSLEVIVVTDCIRGRILHHPIITKQLMTDKEGYSAVYNEGLAAADGDYILLVNADVVFRSNWMQQLTEAIDQGHAMVHVQPDDTTGYSVVPTKELLASFCWMIPKQKGPFFDEAYSGGAYYEDHDSCMRLQSEGKSYAVVHGVLIGHSGKGALQKNPERDRLRKINAELFRKRWL